MTTMGVNLYRYKGILSVKGENRKYVFQGVHMLWGATFTPELWGAEPRECRAVFIGKNLDREAITAGFMECIAKPLRFEVGSTVEARVSKGWRKGTILKHWDDGNAYRIKLQTGEEVWAPIDADMCVKQA